MIAQNKFQSNIGYESPASIKEDTQKLPNFFSSDKKNPLTSSGAKTKPQQGKVKISLMTPDLSKYKENELIKKFIKDDSKSPELNQ